VAYFLGPPCIAHLCPYLSKVVGLLRSDVENEDDCDRQRGGAAREKRRIEIPDREIV